MPNIIQGSILQAKGVKILRIIPYWIHLSPQLIPNIRQKGSILISQINMYSYNVEGFSTFLLQQGQSKLVYSMNMFAMVISIAMHCKEINSGLTWLFMAFTSFSSIELGSCFHTKSLYVHYPAAILPPTNQYQSVHNIHPQFTQVSQSGTESTKSCVKRATIAILDQLSKFQSKVGLNTQNRQLVGTFIYFVCSQNVQPISTRVLKKMQMLRNFMNTLHEVDYCYYFCYGVCYLILCSSLIFCFFDLLYGILDTELIDQPITNFHMIKQISKKLHLFIKSLLGVLTPEIPVFTHDLIIKFSYFWTCFRV